MIPTQTERTVYAAETDSARFGISAADSVHLMTILRDTLYSDKVLAVIREYSANAWDAAHGTPIEVELPTATAPVFSVRDRGPGLPHDGVMRHFTQYGARNRTHFLVFPTDFAFPAICHASGIAPPNPEQA